MDEKEMEKFDMKGVPSIWKEAIRAVYRCYPAKCLPQGICDMAYMANVMKNTVEKEVVENDD